MIPQDNPIYEQSLEFELILLARAIVGLDTEGARKVSPAWCLRPESAQAYSKLKGLSDDVIRETFSYMFSTDKYLQSALEHAMDDAGYPAKDILAKMRKDYISRAEKALLEKYNNASTDKQKLGYLEALQSLYRVVSSDVYFVDVSADPPNEEFLLTWQDVPFLPKGDMTTVKAKAKSGKTQFVKQIIAALISPSGQCNGITRARDHPYRVYWMDTEQSHCSSYKAYKMVLRLAGIDDSKNDENLTLANSRMQGYKDRFEQLENDVRHADYDVVVLDGIKDVVKNINDPEETDELMSRVLRLIQDRNINLLSVIHENPNGEDAKMRGWLGTELANKSFEVFEIKPNKETEIFTVENTERREAPIPPFGFKFEDGTLVGCEVDAKWTQSQSHNRPDRETKAERDWNQFTKAFEDNLDLSLTQKEIVDRHLAMGTMKQTTVKNRIEEYVAQRRLTVDGDGRGARYGLSLQEKYKIRQRLNGEDLEPSDEAPF